MKIKSIELKNFRLLEDNTISLEDDITLIVGKNNTGKTSFFEAIRLFTEEGESKLCFEDFSQSSYLKFIAVFAKYEKYMLAETLEGEKEKLENEIKVEIPKVQLTIEFDYGIYESLIELSEFITDLDPERTDVSVLMEFSPKDSLKVFQYFVERKEKEIDLIRFLKDNIRNLFSIKCFALDKKSGYKSIIEESFKKKLQKVVLFENIQAMRVLDDSKNDRNNTLSLGFSNYYNQRDKENVNVKQLEKTLEGTSSELEKKYGEVLEPIKKKLSEFGAKTPINIPDIEIHSEFDSEKIMKSNIKYYYKQCGIELPESYNGLGYSNLIYMILELESFIEKFKNKKDEKLSNFLVVMIEEPEAHMHPQMQQVFISQIKDFIQSAKEIGVPVQMIITSHSSHILAEAGIDVEKGFKRIRYFNKKQEEIDTQDFNDLKLTDEKRTARFLKQYLTITKSDLFFADKIILVEGTTERMLLPQMIKKVAPGLLSEYVTILEVGGAYAHKFKELLEFIETKTLVITDIDSADGTKHKTLVADAELTTNETLIQWMPGKNAITDLVALGHKDKTKGKFCVAYQTSENGYNARSFEDAFINTNTKLLQSDKDGKEVKKEFTYFRGKNVENKLFTEDSKVKTNFAFDIMTFDETTFGEWQVPEYIAEGLKWLAKND